MKILQINTIVNSGSIGRIAEDIGKALIEVGHKSYIASAYIIGQSKSEIIKIGSHFDYYIHGFKTRLFDRHGFGSLMATRNLVKKIEKIDPDIIHLHNLHGYYIHIGVLFNYLKNANKPVVWTLHDCWPFTGHCSHFERLNCYKWQIKCYNCPNKIGYPASWLIDNSERNFNNKKRIFCGLTNLHIVTPSNWLANHLKKSFLKEYPLKVINNGIDIQKFKPSNKNNILKKYNLENKKIILGVANIWKKKKAFNDFIELSRLIQNDNQIFLVGLDKKLIKRLPDNIKGFIRTESIEELAQIYSEADVIVNPTYADNFPNTDIEALSCGTPVITYNTGGSPEAIDDKTGIIVNKGDIKSLSEAVKKILKEGKDSYSRNCRERAEKKFDSKIMCEKYLSLYKELIQ